MKSERREDKIMQMEGCLQQDTDEQRNKRRKENTWEMQQIQKTTFIEQYNFLFTEVGYQQIFDGTVTLEYKYN